MRVFGGVVLVVALLEAVLALVFLAGYYWIGGWWVGYQWVPAWVSGLLLMLGVGLLLLAPWLGELGFEYDSQEGKVAFRAGWLFAVTSRKRPEAETRVRVLGIPVRSKRGEKKAERAAEKPEEKPARKRPRVRRKGRPDVRAALRDPEASFALLLAGGQALHGMLWEARELRVEVQAPAQVPRVDEAVAGAVGQRKLGPLDLGVVGSGKRAVRVRYRIGLLRAGLTVLMAALQGRPWRLRGALRGQEPKVRQKREETEPKEAE